MWQQKFHETCAKLKTNTAFSTPANILRSSLDSLHTNGGKPALEAVCTALHTYAEIDERLSALTTKKFSALRQHAQNNAEQQYQKTRDFIRDNIPHYGLTEAFSHHAQKIQHRAEDPVVTETLKAVGATAALLAVAKLGPEINAAAKAGIAFPKDMAAQLVDYTINDSIEHIRSIPGLLGTTLPLQREMKTHGGQTLSAFDRAVSVPLRKDGETPLSHMQTATGLLTDPLLRSQNSIKMNALLTSVYTGSAIGPVFSASAMVSSKDTFNAWIAQPGSQASWSALAVTATLIAYKEGTERFFRDYASRTLHRLTIEHKQNRINEALSIKSMARSLTGVPKGHDRDGYPNPENADEIISGAYKAYDGNVLGLSQGGIAATSSIISNTAALLALELQYGVVTDFAIMTGDFLENITIETATLLHSDLPSEFIKEWAATVGDSIARNGIETAQSLEHWIAEKGSAYGTMLAILTGVGIITRPAFKVGNIMKRVDEKNVQADGERRTRLKHTIEEAAQITYSDQRDLAKRVNDRSFAEVNKTNKAQISWDIVYGVLFRDIYDRLEKVSALSVGIFGAGAAAGAAVLAASQGAKLPPSTGDILATSAIAASTIGSCSWFINVMPGIAGMQNNRDLSLGLTRWMERAKNHRPGYEVTSQDARLGLIINNLKLHHNGEDERHISAPYLRLMPGDRAALVGSSGCGKSTLMNAIIDQHKSGSGEIKRAGHDHAVCYLSQGHKLLTGATLKELCMPAGMHPNDVPDEVVIETLEKFGLGENAQWLHSPKKQSSDKHVEWRDGLSGGEQVRVNLARAYLTQTLTDGSAIIMFDEVLNALDAQRRTEIVEAFIEANPEAIMLFISHDTPVKDKSGASVYTKTWYFDDNGSGAQEVEQLEDYIPYGTKPREIEKPAAVVRLRPNVTAQEGGEAAGSTGATAALPPPSPFEPA